MPPTYCSNPRSESLTGFKVGVFLGGDSSERSISLRSGRAVFKALQREGIAASLWDPARGNGRKWWKECDLAFVAMHGHGGEDGILQRKFEKYKIAYTGSDPQASRRAFNKKISKRIFQHAGIPTPEYRILQRENWEKALLRFEPPYFVKPVANGSSIGVFCVENLKRSRRRIRKALNRFGELIAERKIEGREFTVGVLGGRALPVIELRPKRKFYDYRAKYTKGMTRYLVPAPIPKDLEDQLQKIALKVHRVLGLRDFSRTDMMADAKGRIYVLEANAIPGLTELSLVPKAARAAGISFEELCTYLLSCAKSRLSRRKPHVLF